GRQLLLLEPGQLVRSPARRPFRHLAPRRARRGSAARGAMSGDLPEPHVEQAGPVELRDPLVRQELKRASVWIGLVLAALGVILLAQPLLLIFAGIVFASMLDGGTRLLGRVLPIGRRWRLLIVTLAAVGFVVWTIYFTGTELTDQAGRLRET